MKIIRAKIFVLIFCLSFTGISLAEEAPKINYDCSFAIELGGYPSECFDQNQSKILYITEKIRTKKRNGKFVYVHSSTFNIPSLVVTNKGFCGSAIGISKSTKIDVRIRKREFAFGEGRRFLKIKRSKSSDTVQGEVLISNPSLYIGGACASCVTWFPGVCTKVS